MMFNRYSFILPVFLALLLSGCAGTEKAPLNNPLVPDAGNVRAAKDALQLQGQPYTYGGQSPEEGFDCSGLVVYVYNQQGTRLPRSARSLARQLPPIKPELREPGDLLFFHTDKPFSHVGIYVGNDNFVHAPSSRTGRVMVSSLRQPYWRARFIGVRRPTLRQAWSSSFLDEHKAE
ncbi:C40 family peptidase [Methylomonas sp. MgM2]